MDIDTVIASTRVALFEGNHTQATDGVGDALSLAYRDLVGAEARLGEVLSRRGLRIGVPLADQWPVLHEYLSLYARGLSPAGMVVFAGSPDAGSRLTGIPFTGAREAREQLGLATKGSAESPSGTAFWRAVGAARAQAHDAPVESLMGSVHLAHALPFDFAPEAEVRDAGAKHALRVLASARPQAIVCVGADAVGVVGRALEQPDLVDLASAPESSWAQRWPPGTRLTQYPYAEVPVARPFRARIVPVPSLVGAQAKAAERALAALFASVL